jgi:hypothetical protein
MCDGTCDGGLAIELAIKDVGFGKESVSGGVTGAAALDFGGFGTTGVSCSQSISAKRRGVLTAPAVAVGAVDLFGGWHRQWVSSFLPVPSGGDRRFGAWKDTQFVAVNRR